MDVNEEKQEVQAWWTQRSASGMYSLGYEPQPAPRRGKARAPPKPYVETQPFSAILVSGDFSLFCTGSEKKPTYLKSRVYAWVLQRVQLAINKKVVTDSRSDNVRAQGFMEMKRAEADGADAEDDEEAVMAVDVNSDEEDFLNDRR